MSCKHRREVSRLTSGQGSPRHSPGHASHSKGDWGTGEKLRSQQQKPRRWLQLARQSPSSSWGRRPRPAWHGFHPIGPDPAAPHPEHPSLTLGHGYCSPGWPQGGAAGINRGYHWVLPLLEGKGELRSAVDPGPGAWHVWFTEDQGSW